MPHIQSQVEFRARDLRLQARKERANAAWAWLLDQKHEETIEKSMEKLIDSLNMFEVQGAQFASPKWTHP